MRVYAKKVRDALGYTEYVLFEGGSYSKPLLILSEVEMEALVASYKEQKARMITGDTRSLAQESHP